MVLLHRRRFEASRFCRMEWVSTVSPRGGGARLIPREIDVARLHQLRPFWDDGLRSEGEGRELISVG
jgi:hypothetical protein